MTATLLKMMGKKDKDNLKNSTVNNPSCTIEYSESTTSNENTCNACRVYSIPHCI
jgi:hypothetical protein